MPYQAYGAWFDLNWKYRVPVVIPAGAAVNSTIRLDVDFAALLTTLGVGGTFDINSPRIVRPNDALSTNQQYTDQVFASATDAANNSRGEIRFILQDAGPATYYLYFDVTASGTKPANPQTPINGNFEFGTVNGASPQTPPGWLNATRFDNNNNILEAQIKSGGTVAVTDQTAVNTNGNPNTGAASYMQGFRANADPGGNAALTRTITIPASNPGNITVRIRPQGWDSAENNNTSSFDFIRVRLLSGSTVLLDVVGPALNNYATCPFSPNYRASAITTTQPGYGLYNYWDNGSSSNNHTLGMSATYNRGLEPWITCSASLASVAGQTVTLEISSSFVSAYRSWFLIDDIEWSVVNAALGSPEGFNGILPANFNCVERSANASTGRLFTKLAGTAFTFDVVALRSNGSVETNFVSGTGSKNVTVELVDGAGSTPCASRTALSPAVSQTLNFVSSDQGRETSTPITVNNAYPNVRCRVTDAYQLPNVVACSADNFSIRPSGFTVTSANANADAAGTNTSGTPIIKAGANFTLAAASGVAGYNLTPVIDSTKISAHGGAVQIGALSGSFSAANPASGTATGTAFTYSEVGYFRLAAYGVYDAAFTAVDSAMNDCITNNFSNTATASGLYGCNFGNITATNFFGRFIPDHFDITQGTVTPACSPAFTYFGQDGFTTLFTLTAQNSNNITTQNYHGGFAKLGLTAWSGFNFTTAASLPAGSVLSASATAPTGAWNQGLAAVTAKHQVSRPTALTGETSVTVRAAPCDSDGGITVTPGAPIGTCPSSIATIPAAPVASATPLRYGRLNLQSAHGSELLPLPVSLTAQYWNGSAFVLNTDDNCTAVTAPTSVAGGLTFYTEVPAAAPGNHLSSTETAASVSATGKLAAGNAQLAFTAPGSGNDGFFDITYTAPNWLRFDWNAAIAGEESPSGRVTFGIYKGNNSQIFLREVY